MRPSFGRRLRRLLQFRLRTLLLAVTIACVWLGWHVHQAREQRANVQFLRANYGQVFTYGWDLDPNGLSAFRSWLCNLLGPDVVYDVVGVDLVPRQVVIYPPSTNLAMRDEPSLDELFECLADLPALRRLRLDVLEITDAELARIGRLKNLEFLSIQYARGVTDAGLAHLESLPKLQHLTMDYAAVTQDGIDRLQRALPQCRIEW